MEEHPLDIGGDAVATVLGLLGVALLALAFTISGVMALAGGTAPGHSVVTARIDDIPPDQRATMEQAADGAPCSLPWQVLAAIARVESGFGRNMATSSAGAVGYGQFLPATWTADGQGGDPFDYHDALPAMARYLCAAGAGHDLRAAVFAYNHAAWYVDDVFATAARYGYLAPGSPGARVVDVARTQLGVPYVWGGTSPSGFDCSGLVQWSYGQTGVALPRTAQAQYDATARVETSDLRPGDLVFFAQTYPSLDWVTHVGLYLGGGLMINAPTTGDVVRVLPVFTGYWGDHYAGAGRVGG